MRVRINPKRLMYASVVMMITVLYVMLTIVTPPFIDDWMFMGEWIDATGGTEFSWEGWMEFIRIIRDYDNSRLANILSPVFSLFSPFKEIFPIFNGLAYSLMIISLQWLATEGRQRTGIIFLALTWTAVILFLPFYNNILIIDYTLNYVWSAAFSLLFIYIVLGGERLGWSPARFSVALLISLFAGGFHEGFAIPTLCGLGLLMLTRRFRMSWQFYVAFVALLFFALLFGLSGGIIDRFNYTTDESPVFPQVRVWIVAAATALLFLLCATGRGGRRALKLTAGSRLFPVCIGIFITSYMIGFLTVHASRCYFYGNIAVIAIAIRLLFCLWEEYNEKRRIEASFWTRAATSLLLILCGAQTMGVIYWQKIYGDETKKLYAIIEASDTGIVEYDFQHTENPPKYTLGMPVSISNIWGSFWQYRALNWYLRKPILSVVPSSLRHINPEQGLPVEGNIGALKVDSVIITTPLGCEFEQPVRIPVSAITEIKLRDGKSYNGYFTYFPFIRSTDTLLYLATPGINPEEIESIILQKEQP